MGERQEVLGGADQPVETHYQEQDGGSDVGLAGDSQRLREKPGAPCRLHRVQSTGAYPGTRPATGISNLSEAPYPTLFYREMPR